MDDEIENFEAELVKLTPRGPSRDLLRRLEAELSPRNSRVIRRWWPAAIALPLAAAMAVAVAVSWHRVQMPAAVTAARPPAAIPANVLKPVSAAKVLYALSDEGIVTFNDGTRARRERLEYLDTITWENPRTHASLTWSVPREEVRVVPIRYE